MYQPPGFNPPLGGHQQYYQQPQIQSQPQHSQWQSYNPPNSSAYTAHAQIPNYGLPNYYGGNPLQSNPQYQQQSPFKAYGNATAAYTTNTKATATPTALETAKEETQLTSKWGKGKIQAIFVTAGIFLGGAVVALALGAAAATPAGWAFLGLAAVGLIAIGIRHVILKSQGVEPETMKLLKSAPKDVAKGVFAVTVGWMIALACANGTPSPSFGNGRSSSDKPKQEQ